MSVPDEKLLTELEFDIRNLFHLLDVLCDKQFGSGDSERCDALLWIARDRADKICQDAHAAIWPGDDLPPLRMTGGQRNG